MYNRTKGGDSYTRILIGQKAGRAVPGWFHERLDGSPSRLTLYLPGHSRTLLQMLRKALSRTFPHGRTFHSSATVRRVVATNPVKAEEVEVG